MTRVFILLMIIFPFGGVSQSMDKNVLQVEIAVPGFVDWKLGNAALSFTGPAFELAVDACNQKYAGILNFSLNYLFEDDGNSTSLVDVSTYLLADWYYRKRRFSQGLAVIVAPGVIDSSNVHQLAASWNVLYFQTVVSVDSNYRLPAAPIIATMPSFLVSMARAFNTMIRTYSWSTVFVVLDADSVYSYTASFQRIVTSLNNNPAVTLYQRVISSTAIEKGKGSYTFLLEEFRARSRVMIYFSRADHVRRLLIEAALLNMTNGEYVYSALADTSPATPLSQFGNASWNYDDADDQIARLVFRSLLVVHTQKRDFTKQYGKFLSKIRQRAQEKFGADYQITDQVSPPAVNSFSTITMLARVLNESLQADPNLLRDGRHLARRFLNRSFHEELTNITIDSDGNRIGQIVVAVFVGNESEEQVFLQESSESLTFLQVTDVSLSWPGGLWPPRNEPLCGFNHDKQVCQQSDQGALIAAMLAAGVIGVLLTVYYLRRNRRRKFVREGWWRLEFDPIEILFNTERPSA